MLPTRRSHPTALSALLPFVVGLSLLPGSIAAAGGAATPGAPTARESADDSGESPVVSTDPADGATLSQPARALRVWFDRAPDVDGASLSLEGPAGALEVQGLHTMGENDLMARVVGPMPDGEYTATWTLATDTGELTGSWSFTIRRGGR